jgi:hypothetical protein
MKYADIMRMYQNKYLGAWDLIDRDGKYREMTFKIVRVAKEKLTREGGDKEDKPVLYLSLNDKPYRVPAVLSRRNAKAFASTIQPGDEWEGQEITFYVEDRMNFGSVAPTLSVRGKSRRGQAVKEHLAEKTEPE